MNMTWQYFVKDADIKPSTRPVSGTMSQTGMYSDRGNFYDYVSSDGKRTAKIYLRPDRTESGMFRPGNLGIDTPGRWGSKDTRELVDELFGSQHTSRGVHGLGITPQQTISEILAHDNASVEGGSRIGVLSNITGPVTRLVAKLRRPNEKDPTAVTDVRRPDVNPGLFGRLERFGTNLAAKSVMADEKIYELARRIKKWIASKKGLVR